MGLVGTHGNNFGCLKTLLLPELDRPFSALLEDLHQGGLLEETLVLVNSEMGRNQKIGDDRAAPVPRRLDATIGLTACRSCLPVVAFREDNTMVPVMKSVHIRSTTQWLPKILPAPCITRRPGIGRSRRQTAPVAGRGYTAFGLILKYGTQFVFRRPVFYQFLWMLFLLPVTLRANESTDRDEKTAATDASEYETEQHPLFERDIVPILNAYCIHCHGWVYRKGDLDLRSLPLMLKGGKSGPAIERGSAEGSLLYQRIAQQQMPPTGEVKQELSGKDFIVANVVPTEEHLRTIAIWIDAGAPARYQGGPVTAAQAPPFSTEDLSWWAFQKTVHSPPPGPADLNTRPSIDAAWQSTRTPVDAFLLAKLTANGLVLNEEAPQVTMIRRAYLDVIGIPPSPDEVDDYAADRSPAKYERLIDRLLASPHYGERWSRHWLDGAGYSEIRGREYGGGPAFLAEGIWRYRDYVIRSWNADKPYDRFLTEQLAGDELVDWRDAKTFTPEIKESLIATGYLRLAADFTAPNNNGDLDAGPIRTQVINDTLEIFGTHVLGLTLQCAQCHSHKYEPISQRDYYQLRGLFAPALDFQNWLDYVHRFQYEVSASEHESIQAANAAIDTRIAELNQQLADVRAKFRPQAEAAKWQQIPEAIRAEVKVALALAEDQRNAEQKALAEEHAPSLEVKPEDIDAILDEVVRQQVDEIQRQIATLPDQKGSPGGHIQALWDVGPPPPQHIFRRGQFTDPGAEVTPGVIGVLDNAQRPFQLPAVDTAAASSGYRAELAAWLTQPDTPAAALTSRVLMNRVWQHYFERGIVSTSGNLGRSGAEPTHPELLNWLAAELMHGGWRIKPMQRLILTSTAYRQSSISEFGIRNSDSNPQSEIRNPQSIDPDNHLLWRMPLRRLDAEIIRDAVLAVSGVLDPTPGGPSVPVSPTSHGLADVTEAKAYRWSLEKESIYEVTLKLTTPTSRYRRSVYLFARRNNRLTELSAFDQPVVNTNCTGRTSSATVQQALVMLNGNFAQEQAEHFARRVQDEAGSSRPPRIERAFRLALGRVPTDEESDLIEELLTKQNQVYAQSNSDFTPQQSEDAALVDLCQMLFNANEFLYVE